MESSTELVQLLSECIKNCETNKALEIFHDEKYASCVENNIWALIPVLCAELRQDVLNSQPALFACCEKLLCLIAQRAVPEEALLEFIEQAECPDNDLRFVTLLKPLQQVLTRMPDKRGRSLEWCLNLVASHLSELPEPENYHYEADERKLLDLDPAVRRIVDMYRSIVPFYQPFVNEVSLLNPPESLDKPVIALRQRQRILLAGFFIHVLGKPLAQLDLEYDGKAKSGMRAVAEEIVGFLTQVVSNIFMFLPFIEERYRQPKKKKREDPDWDIDPLNVFLIEDKVPLLGLANFMYLVLVEGVCAKFLPRVYSPAYIFHVSLHLCKMLLLRTEDFLVRKGLLLADAIINLLSECSVPYTALDLPVHQTFCLALERVMVYSEVQADRQLGVKVLQNYILKMDLKARYQVFLHLFPRLEHSGVKGVLATQLKDTIRLSMTDSTNPASALYRGRSLFRVIMVFCTLPDGAEVDLMDHSDQVISVLNLVWYLAMADRSDTLGLKCYARDLDKNLIRPLKEALKMSRAHYELKIHHLEEEKYRKVDKQADEKENPQVTVSVRGEDVHDLSYVEKRQILDVALNKFAIMETLLSNIREAVERQLAPEAST